mmetsp:Transcript_84743/g.133384  ORF Transcript_84743/g.133384 Transcript_84743/m.133384 type:complete len:268 (+) Transcript_84743:613-1416(+)
MPKVAIVWGLVWKFFSKASGSFAILNRCHVLLEQPTMKDEERGNDEATNRCSHDTLAQHKNVHCRMTTAMHGVHHTHVCKIHTQHVIKDKQEEVLVISMSHTVYQPWTEMVHAQYVLLHGFTIMRSVRLKFLLLSAKAVGVCFPFPLNGCKSVSVSVCYKQRPAIFRLFPTLRNTARVGDYPLIVCDHGQAERSMKEYRRVTKMGKMHRRQTEAAVRDRHCSQNNGYRNNRQDMQEFIISKSFRDSCLLYLLIQESSNLTAKSDDLR